VALAKTSVEAMAAWNAVEAWSQLTTDFTCGYATATGVTSNLGPATLANCKLECLKYPAWPGSTKTENG